MTSAAKVGIELLHDPSHNKSTAFTEGTNQAPGLVGAALPLLATVIMQTAHGSAEVRP